VSLRRELLLPILLIAVLAGLTIYTGFSQSVSLRRSQAEVTHTHEVLETARGLFSSLQDAETGQRGYLLTGRDDYLEPWRAAKVIIPGQLARLRTLTADNRSQVARVSQLEQAISERIDLLEINLRLGRAGNLKQARANVATGVGKARKDRIRLIVGQIVAERGALLARRQAVAEAEERKSLVLTLGVGGLALCGLAFAVAAMAGANRDLRRALVQRDAARSGKRDADNLIRAVFENIPDYLYTFEVTPDGRFLIGDFNPALARLLGGDMTPYRGRDVMEAFPVMGPRLVEMYSRVIETGRATAMRDSAEVPGVDMDASVSELAQAAGAGALQQSVAGGQPGNTGQ